jgi:hypothetical protein
VEDVPYHPWLRVCIAAHASSCGEIVVLTRRQVEQVHAELGWWLDNTGGGDQ